MKICETGMMLLDQSWVDKKARPGHTRQAGHKRQGRYDQDFLDKKLSYKRLFFRNVLVLSCMSCLSWSLNLGYL